MRSRRWLWAGVIALCALAPTVLTAGRALADDDEEEGTEESAPRKAAAAPKLSPAALAAKRRKILTTMATDETVLVNITAAEMPASPDVLNIGRKGAKALARCVSDNVDDVLRFRCAELLGRLGDRAALPALQGGLEAWSPPVRGASIRSLAQIPDPSSIEPLKKVLEREDETFDNRAAALVTLGNISDQRSVRIVRASLRDTKKENEGLRAPAFKATWKSRHLMARATLLDDVRFALTSGQTSLIVAGTFAAAELRAPELRDVLVRLMAHPEVRVRNRAVYALGKIGDRAATQALLAHVPKVRESRMLNNIAFALERLDPPAFFATTKDLIGHKQAQIRMNTAFVLGDVRRPEGLPLLRGALDDKNDIVRVSAVNALGKLDAPEAAAVLEKYVDDPNPSLSRAAIYAIYALSGMKRTALVYDKLYAPATKPGPKREAAIALGKGGDARVTNDLVACLEQGSCFVSDVEGALRASKAPEVPGRVLLAWTGTHANHLDDLLVALRPPGAGSLALSRVHAALATPSPRIHQAVASVDLAGSLSDAQALEVLKPLLTHDNARLRAHAAVALARSGRPEADATLLRDFDDAPHQWLPSLARAMARITEPAARARLKPELLKREGGSDPALAMAAAAVRLAWEPEAAFFRLLDGLASSSRLERDLAERYLQRNHKPIVTSLMRRALAREQRDTVKGALRRMLDVRAGHDDGDDD